MSNTNNDRTFPTTPEPTGPMALAEEGGRELYYIDAQGKKQDAELWDEILGDDDQDVIQLSELAEPEAESEVVTSVSKLGQLKALLARTRIQR